MKDSKRDPKFLNLPKFAGGKVAFQEFVKRNLRYPMEALDKKIEGTVFVTYQVDGLGNVIDAQITKGIGFGCNEEAVRVIKLMKFEKAKNRGMRVTATMHTRINFELPKTPEIQFDYKPATKPSTTVNTPNKPSGESYSYTITF